MKKLDTKSIVLICLIVLVIITLFIIFVVGLTKDKENTEIITTTTTTKEVEKEIISFNDEIHNIKLEIEKHDNIDNTHKLVVEEVKDKIKAENLVKVYDINLYDKNNNLVSVKDTKIIITIPYEETIKYDSYNVLYLSDTNEVLETIPATYLNGYITFNVNHLSRYAIVGILNEETIITSTTRRRTSTTTMKVEESTTTKQPETTTKKVEETTTKKVEETTTKKIEETTTQAPTTTIAKSYHYQWKGTVDAAGQDYLFIVDEKGNKVNAIITINYIGSDYNETLTVTTEGVLLIKDIIRIININIK